MESCREIFNATSDALFIHDEEGRILDVNDTMCAMYGCDHATALACRVEDISQGSPPYSQVEAAAWMRQALDAPQAFEWHSRRFSGDLFWTEITLRSGQIEGNRRIFASVRDISARKQAETALRASEERFRFLSSMADEGILVHRGGIIIEANHAAAKMGGYADPEEVIGKPASDWLPARSQGVTQPHLSAQDEVVLDFEVMRPDGSRIWVQTTGRPILYQGAPARLVYLRDITQQRQAEKALRDSEYFLRKSQSIARIGTYDLDITTGVWRSSTTLDEIFGIDASHPHDVESWAALIHPEDRSAMMDYLQHQVLGRKQRFDREYRVLRSDDGVERWVYSTGELEFDELGRPVRLVGTTQDISQHIHSNEALVESERRFRNLVQHSADVITVLDAQGVRTYMSGPVEQVFGYTAEELLGHRATDTVHPDDRERVTQVLVEAMGRPGCVARADYRIQHKNGSWVFLEAVGTNLLHDPATRGIVLNVRDLTERKRGEMALREKEERYRLVSELSGQLIHDYDVYTGHMEWAGKVSDITGFSAEEFNKQGFAGWQAWIHPEDRAKTLSLLEEARQRHSPYTAHYRAIKKCGELMYVSHQGAFLYDERGLPTRMLGSVKDETQRIRIEQEQVKLQEQLQQAVKMEAVGRLAGGVAHDFNNLLTVISGNLELTKMELTEADPLLPCLEEIEKAAQSAAALTRQLLAFSRRQMFDPRVVNLNELVGNLHRMLARVIGEDVLLELRLVAEPGPVRVDPAQFEHVLVNLAVNARDAMPGGGRLLIETENLDLDEHYCTTHPYVRPGPYVGLSVSDTGQGMSAEVKKHLFEPFFTTKPVGKGTGLGLSLIFGVVKQSGGSIEVYSEPNMGTTFKIYLPRVAEPAERLTHHGTSVELPGGRETILLVEDEAKVRELALSLLRRLGYLVLTASNGNEALALAETHGEIDLMMTDVVMPGMNGRDLAQRLLGSRPGMKVLFTSGYAEGLFESPNAELGSVNFIGKPYSLHALAQKVREVLEGTHHG